jgi:lysozyme
MDRDQLLADLERDEGFRGFVYDDATGQPIASGVMVRGNPTIGYGWNLAGNSLTIPHAKIILGWHVDDVTESVDASYPWVQGLSDARQRAVMNMVFNLGMNTFSSFRQFLGLLKSGDYAGAADDLEKTVWYGQVGDRAKRIVAMIRNG